MKFETGFSSCICLLSNISALI